MAMEMKLQVYILVWILKKIFNYNYQIIFNKLGPKIFKAIGVFILSYNSILVINFIQNFFK